MSTPAQLVVLDGPAKTLALRDIALPDPRAHEVVVQQCFTGVCHSQLHTIHAGLDGAKLLGHESTGIALKVGAAVEHIAEGDEVLLTWIPRQGAATRRQPEPLKLTFSDGTVAVPASSGVFSWGTHTLIDEQYLVKAPSTTPLDLASIVGCAVMTGAGALLNSVDVPPGSSVAIWGVGGVGLSTVAAAKIIGASKIIAVDLDDEKLELARRFGATDVVNAAKVDPVEAVRALTVQPTTLTLANLPVSGADFTFDCIGRQISFSQSVAAARSGSSAPGGTAVLVGVPTAEFALNGIEFLSNEKTLRGSVGGSSDPDRDFPIFLKWHQDGLLDLAALVTARYSLDQIGAAVADLEAGSILGRAIIDLEVG